MFVPPNRGLVTVFGKLNGTYQISNVLRYTTVRRQVICRIPLTCRAHQVCYTVSKRQRAGIVAWSVVSWSLPVYHFCLHKSVLYRPWPLLWPWVSNRATIPVMLRYSPLFLVFGTGRMIHKNSVKSVLTPWMVQHVLLSWSSSRMGSLRQGVIFST